MFEELRNTLGLNEDDGLGIRCTKPLVDEDWFPVYATLEIMKNEQVIASIGTNFYPEEWDDASIKDVAVRMDDISADEGVAGEAVVKAVSLECEVQELSEPTGSVLYVSRIDIEVESNEGKTEAALLRNAGALFSHATGTTPGTVVMLFASWEERLEKAIVSQELTDGETILKNRDEESLCYVDLRGLEIW